MSNNQVYVAPSILSADFSQMGEAIKMLNKNGADWIHVDVMDGVFVPNITFGQKMVKDIRPLSDLIMDVHLMITEPVRYVKEFAEAGADIITFHIEATQKIAETISAIKQSGKKVGISIKPNTPVSALKPYFDEIDLVLIMSVEPGFGGQKFMENALKKIELIKTLIGKKDIIIEVDGGITEENIDKVLIAGANAIVAGKTVFQASNKAATIRRLRGISD